jgi:hypothetical protein
MDGIALDIIGRMIFPLPQVKRLLRPQRQRQPVAKARAPVPKSARLRRFSGDLGMDLFSGSLESCLPGLENYWDFNGI